MKSKNNIDELASSSFKLGERKHLHPPFSMNAQLANIMHKKETTYYSEHHMVIMFMTNTVFHQPSV
jgi:hypothetical protein